jgi:flagellar hook-associated protein 3 FlgL
MKISTQFLFDRASQQMSDVQSRLVKTQSQVASGKQVLKPSDAPDQAALIQRYKSVIARQENHQQNGNLVQTRLQAESTALEGVVNLMYRFKELTVQASNDTLTPTDRQTIAIEMQGLRDQILSLANSQDTNGGYLFSGARVGKPAFAAPADDPLASPVYQGDQSRMEVLVGDQRSISLNRPGSSVFTRVVRSDTQGQAQGVGFFQALDDLVTGVRNSDRPHIQRGHGELDSLMEGLNLAQADVGTDQAVLEQQTASVEDLLITLQSNLSAAEDLDYAKAITEMNKQVLSLEAAQSSFAKVSQLSLFQYLR